MEQGHFARPRRCDGVESSPTAGCSDEEVAAVEAFGIPTCGSCSGMFTANSMNCLTGRSACRCRATLYHRRHHADQAIAFCGPGVPSSSSRRRDEKDDASVPRSIGSFRKAFERHQPRCGDGRLHQHRAPPAHAAATKRAMDFTMKDIDRISGVPCLCKVAPAVADVPLYRGCASRRQHRGHSRRTRPQRSAATDHRRPCHRAPWANAGPGISCRPGQQRVRALRRRRAASRPRSRSAGTALEKNSTWTARTA